MLGFVGSGFVRSSKDFQVICCNYYRVLKKGRALVQENYELRRTKENILKLNIAGMAFPDLEEYQEKSERVLVYRQH